MFILSSAYAFNMDHRKIFSFGKELRIGIVVYLAKILEIPAKHLS